MSEEKRITTGHDLGELMIMTYKSMQVTPENSKVVRAACWALLANVLASDYANAWNDAADRGDKSVLLDARKAADQALALGSTSSVPNYVTSLAWYAQGLVLRGEGHHKLARDAFQHAIDKDSKFARAYAQKGTELMYLGKFGDAETAIDEAIKIALGSGDHSLGIMKFNRGRVLLFGNNRDAEAIKSFEEALALRDNVWFTWLYLVSAYALDKKICKAKEKLEKFRKSSVKDANSYTTIAKVKAHQRTSQSAKTDKKFRQGLNKFYRGLELVF